jgi:8-oxo-dGTP diphosphatase
VAEQQTVVGAVIVDSLDAPARVLAARRRDDHLWEFPGGKVEPGEPLAEALRREINEELGVRIRVGDELVADDGAWPISDRLELRLFLAQFDSETPARGPEHSEFRWLSATDLRSLEWMPADVAALERAAAMLDGCR